MDEIFAFAKGQVIFEENAASDGFYVIKSGTVEIYRTVQTDAGPREVQLAQLGPNEIFGEMGLVDLKGRSASCRAMVPTIVSFVSYETFAKDLFQLPPMHLTFVMTLVRRLRNTNNQLIQATVETRRLRDEMERQRTPTKGSARVHRSADARPGGARPASDHAGPKKAAKKTGAKKPGPLTAQKQMAASKTAAGRKAPTGKSKGR